MGSRLEIARKSLEGKKKNGLDQIWAESASAPLLPADFSERLLRSGFQQKAQQNGTKQSTYCLLK